MMSSKFDDNAIIDRIDFFQKKILTNFDINIVNILRSPIIGFNAKTDNDLDVQIHFDAASIEFCIDKAIGFNNDILISNIDAEFIKNILVKANNSLPVLDGLRFTNDNISYFPVIANIKPSFIFKCDHETGDISIVLHFSTMLGHDEDSDYYLTTKHMSVQNYIDTPYFRINYLVSGKLIHSDIKVFLKRFLLIWDISKNSNDIDFKRLGVLSDMITI